MKLTRRQLVAVATSGSALAVNAFAQTVSPAAVPPISPPLATGAAAPRDFAKESQDGVQHSRETLAKFAIPMSTEPAFEFKA